jgi:hypothetical protein
VALIFRDTQREEQHQREDIPPSVPGWETEGNPDTL